MTDTIWILGASDPEMEAIEALLLECDQTVVHATVNGVRVHPGNANRADAPSPGNYIAVECNWHATQGVEMIGHCDHHHPGDAGFGRPPAEFMIASSLGQVITQLAYLDALPRDWDVADPDPERMRGEITRSESGWWVECGYLSRQIPDPLLFVAAADHCLGAAYRDRCPGVDPTALGEFRAAERAAFQWRPVADVLADIEATTAALRDALTCAPVYLGDIGPACTCHHDGIPRVADMRRETPWPELPEAGTRAGIGYMSGPLASPDGRRKYTISGTPAQVGAWLAYWAPANGITNTYGDPARGFAGGYAAS